MTDLGFYYSVNKLLLILIDIAGIWLGTWVYFSNPHKKQNRLFFLLTISLLFWINGGYFFNFSEDLNRALFLGRIILGEVLLSLVIIYVFLIYFPKEKKGPPKFYKLYILSGVIIFIWAASTDLVVKSVELTEWGMNPLYHSRGKYLFYGLIIFLAFLILKELFIKYFTLSKEEKLKVQYFLIGLFIFVIMNLIFNVVFPLWRDSIRYWQFGNYSAIFLLAFTAYAIVKRELFGIKVVLTALLVGLLAVLILLDIFLLTEDPLAQLFKGLLLIIFLYFGYLLVQSVVREIQYRERLQRAYKELKKLDTAKSEFMSIASHQLRTPLTAIKGYISMILEGSYGQLLEKTRKPMEGIYKSNERLIKLVNDLLSVSRIEAGKIRMKLEKASLEELIESVIEELENEAARKKIYLEWKKPKKVLPKILIDKSKIRAIILNIVDNAIRYTTKGEVTIKAKVSDKIVQISVSDTGTGISKEELSKLFESFSRGVAGSRLYTEGVGLGLYIGRKFAEMHEGKIWAKSKGSGKGSTFYLELPIK